MTPKLCDFPPPFYLACRQINESLAVFRKASIPASVATIYQDGQKYLAIILYPNEKGTPDEETQ